MKCVNPLCGAETLCLRSGSIFAANFLGETRGAGECQIIQRRVIWLCDACTEEFAVETWRPPGEPVRPSGSFSASPRMLHRSQPPEAGI
jgi:hypothetical protein